jgi:hypothetical protein
MNSAAPGVRGIDLGGRKNAGVICAAVAGCQLSIPELPGAA